MFGKNKKLSPYVDFTTGIYKIIIFRKIGNVYTEIDRIKVNVEKSQFKYKTKIAQKDFMKIDTSMIAFRDKNNNYYAFDFDTGSQLTFNQKDFSNEKISIDEIDTYVNRGLIRDLVAGLEKGKEDKKSLVMIVLVGIIGGFIGFFIGYAVFGNMSVTAHALLGVI